MNYKKSLKTFSLLVSCLIFLGACETKRFDIRYAGWENVTLVVTGFGAIEGEWSISARVQAVQAAKINAYAQLESQAMALKTDAGMKVLELVEKDETLAKKVTAFVRGANIIQTENAETGVEIVMELFLGDSFKATLGLSEQRESSPSSSESGGHSPH